MSTEAALILERLDRLETQIADLRAVVERRFDHAAGAEYLNALRTVHVASELVESNDEQSGAGESAEPPDGNAA